MSATTFSSKTATFDPTRMAGLADLAGKFRSRAVSVEQVTRAYLDRIDAVNARLGAFTFVARESALSVAQSMDRLLEAGVDLGPLMGMPIAVKDLYSVSGMPVTAGTSVGIQDLVEEEGPFIRKLKRAGCVILGKTKTTEFAAGTINLNNKPPWNPRDLQTHRMPGGSSSGSGVAMAADLCAFALGTDSGGSVRQPAALCGVAGYKCTPGMWPTDGVFPLSFILDALGIFTKTAADTEYVFRALGDGAPARSVPLPGLRLGIPRRRFFEDLERSVEERIDEALEQLARAGVELVDLDLPEVAHTDEMFARVVPTELAAFLGEARIAKEGHLIDPVVKARLDVATGLKATDYLRLVRGHADAVRSAAARLDGLDGWLSPTTALVAIPVSEASTVESAIAWNQRSMRNTRPINYLGECAISIPLPTPARSLPVGLQLAAAPSNDAHLLAAAVAIERALA